MSLLATFSRLRELESTHGGLIRGALAQRRAMRRAAPSDSLHTTTMFMAPWGGMAEIVDFLSSRLEHIVKRLGRTVQHVVPHGDGPAGPHGYAVHLGDATSLHSDMVVFATPAPITATMIEGFHPRLAEALRAIPYVSSATISLTYRRRDVSHPLDGFGFLVGKREGRRVMAATWTSTKFAYCAAPDAVLIGSFIGGLGHEELVVPDNAALIQLVREEFGAMLGTIATPLLPRVYPWERANPNIWWGLWNALPPWSSCWSPTLVNFSPAVAIVALAYPIAFIKGVLIAERSMATLTPVI